jgi:hypothetical protein
MTFFSEQGLTEAQVLQRVCNLLKERDPTFLISRPFAIPGTDYGLFGKSLEAFFKLSSGSVANMVIFLEAVHRGNLAKEALIELIENQIALPKELEDKKQVHSKDRRKYLQQANMILSKLKSLPR